MSISQSQSSVLLQAVTPWIFFKLLGFKSLKFSFFEVGENDGDEWISQLTFSLFRMLFFLSFNLRVIQEMGLLESN